MKQPLSIVLVASCSLCLAQAQLSISYTNHIAGGDTDWSQLIGLPQFNPALGTLESVEISLGSSMSTVLTINNTSAGQISGSANALVWISVDNSTFTNLFGQGGTGNPVINLSIPKRGYNYSLAAGATVNSGTLYAQQTVDSGVLSDSAVLSGFTGTGTLDFNAATTTFAVNSYHGGNISVSQQTTADLTTTVTYDYSPASFTPDSVSSVPEPSSLALIGLGLAACGRFVRRKQA
jgi:PEP-CTERM motif